MELHLKTHRQSIGGQPPVPNFGGATLHERHRQSPSPAICAWQQWKGGVSALGRARWWDLGR
eukprot:3732740-Prymnesium_polylepis.1